MQQRHRVLLIEDEPVDAALVRRRLGRGGAPSPFDLVRSASLQQGLDRLAKGDVDVVLLDLHLPDSFGLDTLVRLREHEADVPVVVFTAAGEQELATRALEAGAQDYLVKDDLQGETRLLERTLHNAIERSRVARDNQRLHEQLARTDKMASLGVLCAGMATSFQRLLGTILEESDSAVEDLHAPDRGQRLRRHLMTIRSAAFRAGEMTGRLRDYAAARRCGRTPVDLSRFVLEVSDFVECIAEGRAVVHWDLSGRELRILAGRLELHQILLSLVTNAAEAVGMSGCISISTGSLHADEALLERAQGAPGVKPGEKAFLRVTDNGHGMDASTSSRIFEPFFTTRYAGRGLGLPAVLGVLRRLDGVCLVASAPEKGSTFTVLLPLAASPA